MKQNKNDELMRKLIHEDLDRLFTRLDDLNKKEKEINLIKRPGDIKLNSQVH